MIPIPNPGAQVVRTKLVRLLYFMGAGAVCAVGINLWKEYERKSMIQKHQQLHGQSLENPSNVVHKNS